MEPTRALDALLEVVPIVLAALFLASGATKMGSPSAATNALVELLRLPSVRAGAVVRLLGAAEVAAGTMVTGILFPRAGYALALILGLAITVAGGWASISGRKIECGCFGTRKSQPLGWRNVVFGLGIIAMSGALRLQGYSGDEQRTLLAGLTVALVWTLVTHRGLLAAPWRNFTLQEV